MYVKTMKIVNDESIYVEMKSDNLPSPFPATTNAVEQLPNGFKFATGSSIYVVDTDEVYRAKSDGTWHRSTSGGGGGDEDIATPDEVEAVIDNIWPDNSGSSSDTSGGDDSGDDSGDDVASSDEVQGVIDDIWND